MGISPLNRTKRDGHASLAMTATEILFSFPNHRLQRSGARDDGSKRPEYGAKRRMHWTTPSFGLQDRNNPESP